MAASLKPPLFVIITAHPLLEASRAILPKGSSHLEQTTQILDLASAFNVKSCFLKPRMLKFLCSKKCFSLGSSPITVAFQLLYLSKILIIVFPKISNPFDLLSRPTKIILFCLLLKEILILLVD